MNSHIYYGEYSLKHWIELLLGKNITLPEYQRSFVWEESDMKRLIKSFKEKQFVQPITIALFKSKQTESKNLLLDGQQRLTAILLAKLGYMPDLKKFEDANVVASDDDSMQEQEDEVLPKKWTFSEIINDTSQNTIDNIKGKLSNDDRYIPFKLKDLDTSDDFFEKNFLGFSYIVPDTENEKEIQQGFSQLFRNINYFGKKLSSIESRKSLYYMNKNLENYFEGKTVECKDVFCGVKIKEDMKNVNIDFVRYLSILSQYKGRDCNIKEVMKHYSSYGSRESFYADYVSYVLNLEQENYTDKFGSFKILEEEVWHERFIDLQKSIDKIKCNFDLKDNAFTSCIDADYWFFGLIYYVVFEGKKLNKNIDDFSVIKDEIEKKRKDETYLRSPNRLGNLRNRIEKSINSYKEYVS